MRWLVVNTLIDVCHRTEFCCRLALYASIFIFSTAVFTACFDNKLKPTEGISNAVEGRMHRIDSLKDEDLKVYSDSLLDLWRYVEVHGTQSEKSLIAGRAGQFYLYQVGKVNLAESYLVTQRDILESVDRDDTATLIRNYLDLSFLHAKKQEFPFARSYALMAKTIAERYSATDSMLHGEIFNALGKVYYHMLDHEESMSNYHQALQFVSRDKRIDLYNKILIGMINNFNNIPSPDSATFYLDHYYDLNRADSSALAEYYRLYGICYFINDEYLQSIDNLEKAVSIYQQDRSPDPYTSIDVYSVLSSSYSRNNQFYDALQNIDHCLLKRFGTISALDSFKTDISSVDHYASRAEILADSGMVTRDTSLVQAALEMYKRLDTLREHFVKVDIDSYLYQQFYDNYTYWKPMEIYAFLYEETRSVKWLHLVHDLITKYKAQGFNRDRILNQLYHSPTGKEPYFKDFVTNDLALEEAIRADDVFEINKLLRYRHEIFEIMSKEIPDVISMIIEPSNISSAELLEYTNRHDLAIINYYIGNPYYNEGYIYVLIAAEGIFSLQIINQSPDILAMTDTFYSLNHRAASAKYFNTTAYYHIGHELYNRLFYQTAQHLKGISRLVIIPDESLHTLSFEGLVVNDPGAEMNGDSIIAHARYLVEDYEITYAYSPNDLLISSEDSHTFPVDILVMAYSSRETLMEPSDSIPELNSAVREMEVIQGMEDQGSGKYFSGFDCTKSNFLEFAEDAEIIHISTHGAFDADDRTSSLLYLRKGKEIDALYQHELRYKDIQPRLIVLSACDSGAGKQSNEEGMFSIGRTFQAFGADEAVTALWPLSGNASAELFELFYADLFNGKDAQASLRNTKLKMIRSRSRYATPEYWGALVMHL